MQCGAQKVSAGVCSLSVDAVPVTGGCCAADNTQPSPADFRSIFQIVIKRTAATSNKCVTIEIIIIVKCKIVHYRLYYRQVTSHSIAWPHTRLGTLAAVTMDPAPVLAGLGWSWAGQPPPPNQQP